MTKRWRSLPELLAEHAASETADTVRMWDPFTPPSDVIDIRNAERVDSLMRPIDGDDLG